MEALQSTVEMKPVQVLYPGETLNLPGTSVSEAFMGTLENKSDRPGWAVIRCGSQMQTFTLAQEEEHNFLISQRGEWLTIRNAGSTQLFLTWR